MGTLNDLESRCAVRWLPRSNDIFLLSFFLFFSVPSALRICLFSCVQFGVVRWAWVNQLVFGGILLHIDMVSIRFARLVLRYKIGCCHAPSACHVWHCNYAAMLLLHSSLRFLYHDFLLLIWFGLVRVHWEVRLAQKGHIADVKRLC